jgi:hypothetical protein
MGQEILYLSIAILVRAVLLAIGLLVVIKILKLDWNPGGLIASSLIVGGLDVIPLAGHFIAPPVLFVCVAMMTHFSLFPGSVVATIVASGLMIGSTQFLDSRILPHQRKVAPIEIPVVATNAAVDDMIYITNSATGAASTNAFARGQTNRPASPYDIARTFTLKSVINNSSNSLATIFTGTRSYTIGISESVDMDTPSGKVSVHCDKINVNSVVLTIANRHVSLFLR